MKTKNEKSNNNYYIYEKDNKLCGRKITYQKNLIEEINKDSNGKFKDFLSNNKFDDFVSSAKEQGYIIYKIIEL